MDSLRPSRLLRGTSRFEKVYYFLVPREFGKTQGRVAVVILGVDVGPVFDQETSNLHIAVRSGQHQGRQAVGPSFTWALTSAPCSTKRRTISIIFTSSTGPTSWPIKAAPYTATIKAVKSPFYLGVHVHPSRNEQLYRRDIPRCYERKEGIQ